MVIMDEKKWHAHKWTYGELASMSVNELGIIAFGSQKETDNWLMKSIFSLECQRPIDVMKQDGGVERVRNVILGILAGFCA